MQAIALIGAAALALAVGPAQANPLGGYLGDSRPVLVFAPGITAPYKQQIAAFEAAAAKSSDRDIAVVGIAGDDVTASPGGPSLAASAAAFRTAFSVPKDEFQVLLIGKDGGVKFRSRKPVDPSEIFRLVDAMPMRKQEMRRR